MTAATLNHNPRTMALHRPHTMLKAIDFEILRGVKAGSVVDLRRQPVRVATMINEAAFATDHYLVHHKTVFLEDRHHDWTWRDGKFRYYSRVADVADVLVVYEESNVVPPLKFDPMTGEPLPSSSS